MHNYDATSDYVTLSPGNKVYYREDFTDYVTIAMNTISVCHLVKFCESLLAQHRVEKLMQIMHIINIMQISYLM